MQLQSKYSSLSAETIQHYPALYRSEGKRKLWWLFPQPSGAVYWCFVGLFMPDYIYKTDSHSFSIKKGNEGSSKNSQKDRNKTVHSFSFLFNRLLNTTHRPTGNVPQDFLEATGVITNMSHYFWSDLTADVKNVWSRWFPCCYLKLAACRPLTMGHLDWRHSAPLSSPVCAGPLRQINT